MRCPPLRSIPELVAVALLRCETTVLESQYIRSGFDRVVSRPLVDSYIDRIPNPLASKSKAELLKDVERYAQDHQLEYALDHLKKGALVAQQPDALETIQELSQDDIKSLQTEAQNRWDQPEMLYYIIALNSIGAAIQGWDQTGSNGANLSFPQEFGITDTGTQCEALGNCETNSWIIGVINAAPYISLFLL